MSDPPGRPLDDHVAWSEIEPSRRILTAERVTLLAGFALVVALILYDTYVAHVYLVGTWNVRPVDWMLLFGLVVLLAYGAIPAARDRRSTRRLIASLTSRRIYAAGAVFLGVTFVAGAIGPYVFGQPYLRFHHAFHAPIGFTTRTGWTGECLGAISHGEGVTRYCHGSLTYPLGTNDRGHGLGHLLVLGARVSLYIVVFTLAFVFPLAAAVGVVAGLRGGRLDDLLMTYVDVQLCVPAIMVYFVGYMYWGPALWLLLATFGLLSWGGIARLVRSETLQRREEGYVLVARSLGAPELYVARRHVLPNITNTLMPALFQLLALLILVEAGIAFLGFHHVELYSWGSIIAEGLDARGGQKFRMHAHQVWWISTFPAIALMLTLTSLKLVGDALRDALDPRGGR